MDSVPLLLVGQVVAVRAFLRGFPLEHSHRQLHRTRPVRPVVGVVGLDFLPHRQLTGGGDRGLRPVVSLSELVPVSGVQDVVADCGVAALAPIG